MLRKRITAVAATGLLALLVGACGSTDDDNDNAEATEAEGSGGSGESCIGETGCVPENQPDVNQDGTVRIGVLSPGDTNDNGYYESFVVTAREFAERNDWELTIVDKVNPADAAEQARSLCRQSVDMVAIAASELKDALPVAEEEVCENSVWYLAGGQGTEQTPYFFQSTEPPGETQYATGYAAGLVLRELGGDKAGYITGPELDFSTTTFAVFTAGLKAVLPDAETVPTYTGSFDDSALGQEAARAQMASGVDLLYPYLGGATDAVVAIGAENGVLSITPGTDRCDEENFAISSIFSPGDYFAAVLADFEEGTVELGTTRTFEIGKDEVPTVKICDSVPNADALTEELQVVIDQIASGELDPLAEAGLG
jgi:basic membrane protein A